MSTMLRTQLAGMQGHTGAWQTAVPYPAGNNAFARRLASPAEMIARGLPMRVVALDANGGHDTHENEAATLATNFGLLAASLAAFQADLGARGVADRVLVHLWSEFGRRPQANGSGTGHGAGGASFVMGTQAKGTMVGEFPGPRGARRGRQPAPHHRLPRGPRGADRAAARRLRGRHRPDREQPDRAAARPMRVVLVIAAAALLYAAGPAGAVARQSFALTTGRWTLLCPLTGHQAAGMRSTLTVG